MFQKYFTKSDELKKIKVNYEDEEETKYELTNDYYFVISTNKESFEEN